MRWSKRPGARSEPKARGVGAAFVMAVLLASPAQAEPEPAAPANAAETAERPTGTGPRPLGQRLLYYVPNRLADLVDPVRTRIRVGPGFGFGLRLTRPLSFYVGGHAAAFVGLRGPRSAPIPPRPFGTEADGSRAVASANNRRRAPVTVPPGYTVSEFGLGFQLAILGIDLGFDPLEVADLAGGLVLLDFRGDDI